MPSKPYFVPPGGDGEILLERAGARVYRQEDNALEALVLGGMSGKELRAELASQLPGEAGKGIAAGGHQPVVPYPGIVFKDIVHTLLAASRGLRPVHYIVDYDLPGREALYYPAVSGHGYERRVLHRGFEAAASCEDAPPDRALAAASAGLEGGAAGRPDAYP